MGQFAKSAKQRKYQEALKKTRWKASQDVDLLQQNMEYLKEIDSQWGFLRVNLYKPRNGSGKGGKSRNGTSNVIGAFGKEKFLATFAATRSFAAAVMASGVNRRTVNEHLAHDQELREQFKELQEFHVDQLEASALQRATQGYEKPVYYKGKIVGKVQEMSDTLAIFMLKNLRPFKYFVEHFSESNTVEDTSMQIIRFVQQAQITMGEPTTETRAIAEEDHDGMAKVE